MVSSSLAQGNASLFFPHSTTTPFLRYLHFLWKPECQPGTPSLHWRNVPKLQGKNVQNTGATWEWGKNRDGRVTLGVVGQSTCYIETVELQKDKGN